ncbi:MAG: guanine deaminase [Proteobacteria bacterium]|nr:guanine deaminase [Pseudomonadota bacterium]
MSRHVYRASIFHLLGDPAAGTDPLAGWFDDGALVVEDGHVAACGAWDAVEHRDSDRVVHYPGALIVPGFVDAHVHYPQIDMIASPGGQLLDWLENYTYPAEMRYADPSVAREAAGFFLDQLLAHGTTTALVFATVHKHSADALFEAAFARNMRLAAGKVLMDRNVPPALSDTAESGYADSAALIAKWHNKGRLTYAVTPRFSASSTEEQLALTRRLLDEHPDILLQTHLSENEAEIAHVLETFPGAPDYLATYEKFGLVTERSLFAHGIHLSPSEWQRLGAAKSAVAFCPTSNLFLGSGLFDLRAAEAANVRVGLGSDIGAGTSLSQLQSMNEAYKVGQMRRQMHDAFTLFHLATLGGARALRMDAKIGNFETGKEADFIVLDPAATPVLARRYARATTPADKLFALAILGDDRAVQATYVMGACAYSRPLAISLDFPGARPLS